MHSLGQTRSSYQRNHLLQTPDTFVRTFLPGLEKGSAIIHASPAIGAAFAQYIAEIEPGGTLSTTPLQRFLYVLEGVADLVIDKDVLALTAGSFVFLPAESHHTLTARQQTKMAIIEKPYSALAGHSGPRLIAGKEESIASAALNGDEDLQVRNLMPAEAGYDFAVNTMTYQPGASLAQVEIHVMEHGLLMLEGGGIYRLGNHWYPVTAGDFIWMAPYCPQWFCAVGKRPAKYLIYKDNNRHPSS